MKHIFLIAGISLSLSTGLFAQNGATMKFTEVLYNFGIIQAKAGVQKHVFTFENTGKDTLDIQKIKVSDPAVVAISNKMKFGPGEKGTLIINFTPKNENGIVQKFISIRSNDNDFPVRQLTVKADVVAGIRTVEDDFPEKIGNLCFKAKHLAFDQLKSTEVRTDTFRVYNAGKKTITMEAKTPPAHIQWNFKPAALAPGKSGFIIVTYDAPKSGIWGLNYEPYAIATNDSLIPDKTLSIGVNIIEDFSLLKEEDRKNPPKVEFVETNHEFGELKQGVKVSYDFAFKNTGKRDLIIHRAKASCGCTVADPEKKVLKPGESSFIKVNFNTMGLSGEQHKSVMVITNDPVTSMVVLTFGAKVLTE